MSRASVYYKKFKETVLGEADEIKIGSFWFVRDKKYGGVMLLTEGAYRKYKESVKKNDFRPFVEQIKKDKIELPKLKLPKMSDAEIRKMFG